MVAFENLRPPFPPNTPPSIIQFIEKCWCANPDERASFEDIGKDDALDALHDNLTNDEKIWIQTGIGHPVYDFNDDNVIENSEQKEGGDEEEVENEASYVSAIEFDQSKNATSIYSSVIPQISKKKMKKSFGLFVSKKT